MLNPHTFDRSPPSRLARATPLFLMLAFTGATAPAGAQTPTPTPGVARFTIGASDALGLVREASDIALAPDGSMYVTDTRADRIQRFDRQGEAVAVWGRFGRVPGRFDRPSSLAVADDGSVYVADTGNDRIQQFDAAGKFLRQWGADGAGDTRLHGPMGVAVGLDGTVYVSDSADGVVKRFTPAGALVSTFGQQGPLTQRLDRPRDLAIGPDGTVYVIDYGNDRIQRFTADGDRIVQFRTDDEFNPNRPDLWLTSIAVATDGTVFASRFTSVHHFDPTGRRGGRFDLGHQVGALAIDGTDRLLTGIEPFEDWSIGVFDVTERPPYRRVFAPMERIGAPSHMDAPAQFSARAGFYPPRTVLATAPDGRIYATDFHSGRLQWFRGDGLFLGERAVEGIMRGRLGQGISVAAAPDGTAWVANAGTSRLTHVGRDGSTVDEINVAGPGRADGIAVLADGSIVIADATDGRIQHRAADGPLIHTWGGGRPRDPNGFGFCTDHDVLGVECSSQPLAVSGDEPIVHVLDSANGRVLRYALDGQPLAEFGGLTAEREIQRSAQAITAGPDGTIYAADTPSHRVVRFATDGAIIGTIDGAPGRAPDRFERPGGLAVSPDGDLVYVADREHGRIMVYGDGSRDAWRVEYYGNPWLTGRPLAIEHFDNLSVDWGTDGPAPDVPTDDWSARFARRVSLTPGDYTYVLTATGGARLWLGKDLVVDAWNARTIVRSGGFVVPSTGESDVQLEFRDRGASAAVHLAFDVAPPPTVPATPTSGARPTPTTTSTITPPLEHRVLLPNLFNDIGR